MILTTEHIKHIQTKLKEAGYLNGEVDGIWSGDFTMSGYRNYCACVLHTPNSRYIRQPAYWQDVPAELREGFEGGSLENPLPVSEPLEPLEPAPVTEPKQEPVVEVVEPETETDTEELVGVSEPAEETLEEPTEDESPKKNKNKNKNK